MTEPLVARPLSAVQKKRVRRVIAEAVAEQGPAMSEQYRAAVDVMRALWRAGYEIVERRQPPVSEPW